MQTSQCSGAVARHCDLHMCLAALSYHGAHAATGHRLDIPAAEREFLFFEE